MLFTSSAGGRDLPYSTRRITKTATFISRLAQSTRLTGNKAKTRYSKQPTVFKAHLVLGLIRQEYIRFHLKEEKSGNNLLEFALTLPDWLGLPTSLQAKHVRELAYLRPGGSCPAPEKCALPRAVPLRQLGGNAHLASFQPAVERRAARLDLQRSDRCLQ